MTPDTINRCPSCGQAVDSHAAICATCGRDLLSSCAVCGATVHATNNFCPSCGCPLDADEEAPTYEELREEKERHQNQLFQYAHDLTKLYLLHRQLEGYLPTGLLEKVLLSGDDVVGERRYVTVLFSDVVGFTELSATLDAEEVFLLMNNCFRLLVEQVYRYGGSVDKFVGDGMIALFGAPIAHENDAERAVRTALGMQESIADFGLQMLPKLDSAIELRIGITSGDVIAGTVGVEDRQSYTVMGNTVNMASRLQQAASAGGILVNEAVYRQTRHLFNYRILPPMLVKGLGKAVPVFEVVGHVSDPRQLDRLPEDQLSAFVGRQNELEKLNRITQDVDQITGGVVFVTGEAGLGKTRLIWEWQRHLPGDLQVWHGAAQNFPQSTYEVWRELILQGLNLQNAFYHEVRSVLLDHLGDETWVPFLEVLLFGEIPKEGNLSSLQPEQLKEQMFIATRRLLQSIAEQHPLIIILDDLQWFDQLSGELLRSLLELSASLPIVFCLGSRSGAKELTETLDHAKALLGGRAIEISLTPLSDAESEELLQQKLSRVDVPETLHAFILEQSQNNPYYLEELVSYVMAEGVDDLRLPGTLRGLIQAQIDRLPETEHQVLSYAAVIGPTVPARLFQAVLREATQISETSDHLANLVKQKILAFDGTNYRFAHNIVHEMIYQNLLSERRRQIHQQVGLALESQPSEETWSNVEQLAYHFAAAEDAQKAIPYLIQAGERAKQRFANETALDYYTTAINMMTNAPQLAHHKPDIYKTMGDLYQLNGDYNRALDHYHKALAEALNSDQRADYSRLIGQVWQRKGDTRQALHWLDQGLNEVAEGHSEVSDIVRGRIYADMSMLHIQNGDYSHAERWGLDAVAILEQTDELSDLARSLNALGRAYYFQNRWRQASRHVERALEIQQQVGDQMGIALSLNSLGELYTVDGRWNEAVDAFKQAIALGEEIGALEGTLGNAHNNLASLYLHRGELELAETHLQKSLEIKQRSGTTFELAQTLNHFGLSRLMQENYAEAEKFIAEGMELCRQNDEQDVLSEVTRYLAEIKLATGNTDEALKVCREAVLLANQAKSKINEGAALRTLARIHLRREEYPQARQAAEASLRLQQKVNHAYEIAQTQAVVAEIALAEEDETTYRSAYESAYALLEQLGAKVALKRLNQLQEQPHG